MYESPDECCKKEDAAVLTAVTAYTRFEEQNRNLESDDDGYDDYNDQVGYISTFITPPTKKLALFCNALPRCLMVTIGVNMAGQR